MPRPKLVMLHCSERSRRSGAAGSTRAAASAWAARPAQRSCEFIVASTDPDREVRQDVACDWRDQSRCGSRCAGVGQFLLTPEDDVTTSVAASSLGKIGASAAPQLVAGLRSSYPFVRTLLPTR